MESVLFKQKHTSAIATVPQLRLLHGSASPVPELYVSIQWPNKEALDSATALLLLQY